ncbi:hypothetical protein HPB52_022418 [Rhipicephalus sanguineus]|uniref:Uncharacterized protein n=1 Tax=Rhipicephalus sanguineus TaxID=34632 RepID=A0A9D4T0D2_RHISA|nr:hypothetical protein HPB52_022418 [Rhipicephalus sanguineus]
MFMHAQVEKHSRQIGVAGTPPYNSAPAGGGGAIYQHPSPRRDAADTRAEGACKRVSIVPMSNVIPSVNVKCLRVDLCTDGDAHEWIASYSRIR